MSVEDAKERQLPLNVELDFGDVRVLHSCAARKGEGSVTGGRHKTGKWRGVGKH